MVSRKLGTFLVVSALGLTLLAAPALADQAPATATSSPAATLAQQIKAQQQANEDLAKQLKAEAGGDLVSQAKTLREGLQQSVDTKLKPLQEQYKALAAQLKTARSQKDQATVTALLPQLADLRQQAQAENAQLQPQRDQLKQLAAQIKTREQAARAVRDQVKPLQQQEKDLASKNHDLRSQLKQAWANLKASLKGMDKGGVGTAMDSIASLRQQMLANLQQVLGLKQQVGSQLQAAVSSHAPSQPASGN